MTINITNKDAVIERLCELVSMVGEKVFNSQIAHDCFCSLSKSTSSFIVGEDVLDFIERAVAKEISSIQTKKQNTVKDVHTEHCCFFHGCKYGENDTCPVVTGLKPQSFPCEDC